MIQLEFLNLTSFEVWVDFKNVTKTLNCRITLLSVNLEFKLYYYLIGSSQLPFKYHQARIASSYSLQDMAQTDQNALP